jgi:crossover junction endodeoxyribonuclease RuvC
MIIFGLDPGTATTGFGVINYSSDKLTLLDYGCIITKKNTPLAERLSQISGDLNELLNHWRPDSVAIEELFFSKNVKTAMNVAHARGAMIQKLSSSGYDINEYKPQQIKESVCGYGRADKKQIQKMVKIILCMDHAPCPDDAADALGAAICHANSLKFKTLCENS